MDLKKLQEEALQEANKELREKKVESLKTTIKNLIFEVSRNNEKIADLQARNADIAKEISGITFNEPKDIAL